ncbi:MAG: selenide, water dikinase SelD [Cyanobacteria bacterium TGS_CYA1]|nr:selenide, water dikinase SelD [Cyanobacteria bacterium TGS_CYA1]
MHKDNKLTKKVKAGGCASKMSSQELASILSVLQKNNSENLLTDMKNFEDACVYKLSEDMAVVQTLDFFPPMLDDPYLFGQIAAANALSDIYAMGAKPTLALNIIGFPTCDYTQSELQDVLHSILRGGADKVKESGALLAGGHSIQLSEPVYGLCATGFVHPKKVLTNGGAQDGDSIVLSKPVGTGVALLGLKGERLLKETANQLLNNMTMLNASALEAAADLEVHALTDVTGFGLIGHLHEMAKASGLNAYINRTQVKTFDQVRGLAREGFVPAGSYTNRDSYSQFTLFDKSVPLEDEDLFFDPQTSGGLLFALKASEAETLMERLLQKGLIASLVGKFVSEKEIGKVVVQ